MRATRADGYRLMHEGAVALAAVEAAGMRIDVPYLMRVEQDVQRRINRLDSKLKTDEIFKHWQRRFGTRTNIGSREQLGVVLFDVLKYRSVGRTRSRRHRTDSESLESVNIPFVRRFLKFERLKKLRATYIQGVLREVKDGFLHPSFNLHIPVSFRSSADSPNSQNIPNRNEELAEIIRTGFIPRKGRMLVEVDFKGAEVCISACYHHDPQLIRYIVDPKTDMHRDMAMQIFGLRKEQVTKPVRQNIKANFVFAEFYGSWYKACAEKIWNDIRRFDLRTADGIPLCEHLAGQGIDELGDCDPSANDEPAGNTFEYRLKQVERDFWDRRFRVYSQWKKDWYARYLQRGWFEMLTGFRCSGPMGRKEVINYPIQGSSFHCLLWSLIRLHKWLKKHRLKTVIIGQIHDSILMDVPLNELNDVLDQVRWIVTVHLPEHWRWICVPMTVEVEGSTENWFRKKPL